MKSVYGPCHIYKLLAFCVCMFVLLLWWGVRVRLYELPFIEISLPLMGQWEMASWRHFFGAYM